MSIILWLPSGWRGLFGFIYEVCINGFLRIYKNAFEQSTRLSEQFLLDRQDQRRMSVKSSVYQSIQESNVRTSV